MAYFANTTPSSSQQALPLVWESGRVSLPTFSCFFRVVLLFRALCLSMLICGFYNHLSDSYRIPCWSCDWDCMDLRTNSGTPAFHYSCVESSVMVKHAIPFVQGFGLFTSAALCGTGTRSWHSVLEGSYQPVVRVLLSSVSGDGLLSFQRVLCCPLTARGGPS